MQIKVDNFLIKLLKTHIATYENDKETARILYEELAEHGMIVLPDRLQQAIRSNLKNSLLYDKLMGKVYERENETGV